MSHDRNKWVIVFLIYADFRPENEHSTVPLFPMNDEMKVELNCLFKDILTTPLNPEKVRLFVIMDRINYTTDDTQPRTAAKTILYQVINPAGRPFNAIVDPQIIDPSITGLGKPLPPQPVTNSKRLAEILKKTKVKDDEEVFLITWDHGSVFGVFREAFPVSQIIEPRKSIEDELDGYPYLYKFWSLALEKKEFRDFRETQVNKNMTPIIQIGYKLYKLHPSIKGVKYLQSRVSSDFKKTLQNASNGLLDFHFEERSNEVLFTEQNSSGELELKVDNGATKTQKNFSDVVFPLEKEPVRIVLGKLDEENVREILSNDELATAIDIWLSERKEKSETQVSVLLMMNCSMMNLHTMYSLRNCVEYLVAPQGGIANPGYNYKAILRYLNEDSYFAVPRKLAIKCVKTCHNKFARKRAKKLNKKLLNVIDSWVIIAVHLGAKENLRQERLLLEVQLTSLNELISFFYDELKGGENPELTAAFKFMRALCYDFTEGTYFMVDILNWLLSLSYTGSVEQISAQIHDLKNLITDPFLILQ